MRGRSFGKYFVLLVASNCAGPLLAGEMQGYFANFSDPAVLFNINTETAVVTVPSMYSTCNFDPPNTVFSVNFTSGLTYGEEVLYGLEWEGGSGPDIFLYSYSPGPCATGTRIGSAVGHTNLESLAYCAADGFFYTVDFDFASPHLGQLVRIDPVTGAGTLVGQHMAPDVRINGMMCDATGQLWAVSSGFGGAGGRNPELLRVDRNTGVETVVGEMGIAPNQTESLAANPNAPGELFAAGKALYRISPSTGEATIVDGDFDQFWSMASLISDLIFEDNFEPDLPKTR